MGQLDVEAAKEPVKALTAGHSTKPGRTSEDDEDAKMRLTSNGTTSKASSDSERPDKSSSKKLYCPVKDAIVDAAEELAKVSLSEPEEKKPQKKATAKTGKSMKSSRITERLTFGGFRAGHTTPRTLPPEIPNYPPPDFRSPPPPFKPKSKTPPPPPPPKREVDAISKSQPSESKGLSYSKIVACNLKKPSVYDRIILPKVDFSADVEGSNAETDSDTIVGSSSSPSLEGNSSYAYLGARPKKQMTPTEDFPRLGLKDTIKLKQERRSSDPQREVSISESEANSSSKKEIVVSIKNDLYQESAAGGSSWDPSRVREFKPRSELLVENWEVDPAHQHNHDYELAQEVDIHIPAAESTLTLGEEQDAHYRTEAPEFVPFATPTFEYDGGWDPRQTGYWDSASTTTVSSSDNSTLMLSAKGGGTSYLAKTTVTPISLPPTGYKRTIIYIERGDESEEGTADATADLAAVSSASRAQFVEEEYDAQCWEEEQQQPANGESVGETPLVLEDGEVIEEIPRGPLADDGLWTPEGVHFEVSPDLGPHYIITNYTTTFETDPESGEPCGWYDEGGLYHCGPMPPVVTYVTPTLYDPSGAEYYSPSGGNKRGREQKS